MGCRVVEAVSEEDHMARITAATAPRRFGLWRRITPSSKRLHVSLDEFEPRASSSLEKSQAVGCATSAPSSEKGNADSQIPACAATGPPTNCR